MNHHLITRREALQLSAGSLLALGLSPGPFGWPGALRAQGAGNAGEFSFIAVNDTHYITEECGAFLERVFKQMKTHEKIDFCLHAGDLCDNGKREQLGGVRELVKSYGVPTYVTIGNHDHLTQTDRMAYEELYPDRLNYRFEHKGWQLIGLDTSEGQKYNNTTIQPSTLKWLDDNLPKLIKTKPTVVFTHFPLGATTPSRPQNADDVLERFKEYNLQAVFNGHFHGYTERQFGKATITTNRCCALKRNNHDGTKEKGYFVCQAKDGKITRTFVEMKV